MLDGAIEGGIQRGHVGVTTHATEADRCARDARADWATAERVVGQLAQDTEGELSRNAMAGQFSQMLFGGLARRRRPDDLVKKEEKKPERADRR